MKKIGLLLLWLSLIAINPAKAQQLTISFPDTMVNPSNISIPVTLHGSSWISRFNLQFSYWNNCAQFLSVESHHPPFNDTVEVSYNMGGATDWVGLHWDSQTPIFLQESVILWIHMNFFGCYTQLNWIDWADSICAFYDANGQLLNTTFISGSLNLLNDTPELTPESPFVLYPNPYSGGDLSIQLPEVSDDYKVWIFDRLGSLVAERIPEIEQGRITLNEHQLNLPSGAYTIRVSSAQHQFFSKFLVLRNY